MADQPPPPALTKARIFARRAASTLGLWVLITAVVVSRWAWSYLALVAVLVIIASWEYFRMLHKAGLKSFARFGMLLAIGYCAALHGYLLRGLLPPADLDLLAIFVAVAGSFALQLRYPIRREESLIAVAVTVLGFAYIAVGFNFAARLMFLLPGAAAMPGIVDGRGALLLLWLIAVTKFADMGAYLTGSLIGRHKMIVHVSPGKTWEGFGGALVFSQIAGCGLYAAFPNELAVLANYGHVITLGLLLAILAVVGDLAESVIKRALGAKDSGSMLPGIGGALDLIDSVCFTAPALYFYLKWFLLV